MYTYNADRGNLNNGGVFKHLALSSSAAAERVEGMFAHQQIVGFNPDNTVSKIDPLGNEIERISIKDHMTTFCDFALAFSIVEYELIAKRPLRLIDLWEDDPIGSAGPGVVDPQHISKKEQLEIQQLFAPFTDVIYPTDVYREIRQNDLKAIKRYYSNNALFKDELTKRKTRSKAIGEDFKSAMYQEIIWLDFTLKLRVWALSKGYDSFVYANDKEGDGSDSFVCLSKNQITRTGKVFEFCKEKYLDEMPSKIREMVKQQNTLTNNVVVYHGLWAQENPMPYWKQI